MLRIPVERWIFSKLDHCWLQELNEEFYVDNPFCILCDTETRDIGRITTESGKIGLKVGECLFCGHIQKSRAVNFELFNDHFAKKWLANRKDRRFVKNEGPFNKVKKYIQPNSRVLEIGCGSGTNLKSFQDFGCEVWGFDPSESEIEIAQRNKIQNVSVSTAEEYIKNINIEFDVIFLRDVLNFISSPYKIMTKYIDFLKENGLFMTSNGSFYKNQFIASCHHATHFNHPTRSALERWALSNSLEILYKSDQPTFLLARKNNIPHQLAPTSKKINWENEVFNQILRFNFRRPFSKEKKINSLRDVKLGKHSTFIHEPNLVEFYYKTNNPPVILK